MNISNNNSTMIYLLKGREKIHIKTLKTLYPSNTLIFLKIKCTLLWAAT